MTIATTSASPNPMLLALLNQLSSTASTSSGSGSSTLLATLTATPSTVGTGAPTSLNAPARPALTSGILNLLMQQIENSGTTSAPGTPGTTSGASAAGTSSALATGNPVQALFTAIDSNGNGSISQSELEKFIEAAGGTQTQADALYAQLDPNGSGSVSEATLTADMKALQGHFHHHHGMNGDRGNILAMLASKSPNQLAGNMASAMDSNKDGVVSQSELTNFVAQNGGTSAQANSLFSALDTSGSSTLSTSDFQNLLTNLGFGSYASATNAYTAAAANTGTSTASTSTTALKA
ncbi:MAG: EF-hand domain-containing protein [Rhizomicrobium sp.]